MHPPKDGPTQVRLKPSQCEVPGEPPTEGQLSQMAVAGEVLEGRPPLVAQYHAEKFDHKFTLGLANVGKFRKYWPDRAAGAVSSGCSWPGLRCGRRG